MPPLLVAPKEVAPLYFSGFLDRIWYPGYVSWNYIYGSVKQCHRPEGGPCCATCAKPDLVDAAAAALAAIAAPGLDRHRIDKRVRELRVLVDHRADLVKRSIIIRGHSKTAWRSGMVIFW